MQLPDDLAFMAAQVGPARVQRVMDCLARRVGSVVCVTEGVRRRHNASAILRSCECFGIHEIHLVTRGFSPSRGASRAAERWVELRRFDHTADSLAELKARGFAVYVADLDPAAFTPETVPVDRPLALLFGSEVRGVSDEARAAADGVVTVPMYGLTESLNVSVSAALILRTVVERRRARVGADLEPAAQEAFLRAWLAAEERALRGRMARTD